MVEKVYGISSGLGIIAIEDTIAPGLAIRMNLSIHMSMYHENRERERKERIWCGTRMYSSSKYAYESTCILMLTYNQVWQLK